MEKQIHDLSQIDLDEFLIIDNEKDFNFLHDEGGDNYEWRDSIDGAVLFTREGVKAVLNKKGNEDLVVNVIALKDALSMMQLRQEAYEIEETQ